MQNIFERKFWQNWEIENILLAVRYWFCFKILSTKCAVLEILLYHQVGLIFNLAERYSWFIVAYVSSAFSFFLKNSVVWECGYLPAIITPLGQLSEGRVCQRASLLMLLWWRSKLRCNYQRNPGNLGLFWSALEKYWTELQLFFICSLTWAEGKEGQLHMLVTICDTHYCVFMFL